MLLAQERCQQLGESPNILPVDAMAAILKDMQLAIGNQPGGSMSVGDRYYIVSGTPDQQCRHQQFGKLVQQYSGLTFQGHDAFPYAYLNPRKGIQKFEGNTECLNQPADSLEDGNASFSQGFDKSWRRHKPGPQRNFLTQAHTAYKNQPLYFARGLECQMQGDASAKRVAYQMETLESYTMCKSFHELGKLCYLKTIAYRFTVAKTGEVGSIYCIMPGKLFQIIQP